MLAHMVVLFLSLFIGGAVLAQEETVSPFYGYTGDEGHRILKDDRRGWQGGQRVTRAKEVCVVPDRETGERVEVPCNDRRMFCRTDVWDKKKQTWVVNPNCDRSQKVPPGFYQGSGKYYRQDNDRRTERRETRPRERSVTPRERTDKPVPRDMRPKERR